MTISQLEYCIAVYQCKNFQRAAEQCTVTQSTLSMQIKKLEQTLGVVIFDRTKKPVQVTPIGEQIIKQAISGLHELEQIPRIIESQQNGLSEELRIGIIPTLSPYLLPLFLVQFAERYPDINIKVEELKTEDLTYQLYNRTIDVGILVPPLYQFGVIEIPLFEEPFVAYTSDEHPLQQYAAITADQLTTDDLWLLEEGHCFRDQVLNICTTDTQTSRKDNLHFTSGSLETLRRLVDNHHGYTILPQLATTHFTEQEQARVRPFVAPIPVRAVSLAVHSAYVQRQTVEALREVIVAGLPPSLQIKREAKIIEWH